MLFSDLKCKDVINLKDCKKLGRVWNLEFDTCSGCILKIVVARENKRWDFWRTDDDISIPFCEIKQIGPDIILVDINC